MATHTLTVDEWTAQQLDKMAQERGVAPDVMASRLFHIAIQVAKTEAGYSDEAFRVAYAEFSEEDVALSKATVAEHRELLAHEDKA